jgi:hypothetical protein
LAFARTGLLGAVFFGAAFFGAAFFGEAFLDAAFFPAGAARFTGRFAAVFLDFGAAPRFTFFFAAMWKNATRQAGPDHENSPATLHVTLAKRARQ